MKIGLVTIPISVSTLGKTLIGNSSDSYITDAARQALGMAKASLGVGQVDYRYRQHDILKRAVIQRVSQLAYGTLRSYPRFIKYWEQQERDLYLTTQSQTSYANANGQYRSLIKDQQVQADEKKYTDSIVGKHMVKDYLELTATDEEGNSIKFVDIQAMVRMSGGNNIVLTTVQGRDFSRKEFISGGDYKFTIEGKITSKYPDIYPEAEVTKFAKLLKVGRVIDCEHTVLRQFKIAQLIILDWDLGGERGCRNVQDYSLRCVAVEPSESIEIKLAAEEAVDNSAATQSQWIKNVRLATKIVDPSSLLTITKKWL